MHQAGEGAATSSVTVSVTSSVTVSVTSSVTSWQGRFGLQLSWDPAELIWGEFRGGEAAGMCIWVKLRGKELKTSLSPIQHPGTGRAGKTELGMGCGAPAPSQRTLGWVGCGTPSPATHPQHVETGRVWGAGCVPEGAGDSRTRSSGCTLKELRAGSVRGSRAARKTLPLKLHPESAPPQPGRCDSSWHGQVTAR